MPWTFWEEAGYFSFRPPKLLFISFNPPPPPQSPTPLSRKPSHSRPGTFFISPGTRYYSATKISPPSSHLHSSIVFTFCFLPLLSLFPRSESEFFFFHTHSSFSSAHNLGVAIIHRASSCSPTPLVCLWTQQTFSATPYSRVFRNLFVLQ